MSLQQLTITNLRNLVNVHIEPNPRFNVICGPNGSGKTSLLETIYYLSMGRSFRTRHLQRIIANQAEYFILFAHIRQSSSTLAVGVERHRNGEHKVRIANEDARSIVRITQAMPLQLLNSDSRLLLTSNPKVRRKFIDWGVFHVEPAFFLQWQHAQRALKQRNAALKKAQHRSLVQLWDAELLAAAAILHDMRNQYIHALLETLRPLAKELLGDITEKLHITYYPGWDTALGLQHQLEQTISRDLQLGYTQYGPHRADLLIRIGKTPVQDVFSQGQQKLLVYALHLAQGIALHQQTDKKCIYLLDDLAAELDNKNRQRILTLLQSIQAQVFLTSLETDMYDLLPPAETNLFHVEQGAVSKIG